MRVLEGVALVVLLAVGGFGLYVKTHPPTARFCTMGLAIVEVGDEMFVTQDQDPAGKDGCDLSDRAEYGDSRVLSRECTVRDADGDEHIIAKPNRDDGTCGIPDPGGDAPQPL